VKNKQEGVVKHPFLSYNGFMKDWVIGLTLVMISFQAYSVEISEQDIISEDEAFLEKTLEKEEVSGQKFSQLVKSTMDLMGPTEEEATPIASDSTTISP
jgi:hypothetical protein